MSILAYILALSANLCFASASLIFTHFSKITNVYWMNMFKAMVALVAGCIALLFIDDLSWSEGQVYFLLSGLMGLMCGDIFLLKAFVLLGPGRSLLLFGFQPLFMGVAAYYLFGQSITFVQLLAILFLLACLFTFSLENKRIYKTWGLKGLAFALIGVCLDTGGVLLTKYGFENSSTHFIQANMIRSFAAFTGFYILSFFISFPLVFTYKKLSLRQKLLVAVGSISGTFLSLSLYMWAIEIGHLASLSAIAVTTPLIAALFESIYNKKLPTKYFVIAFIFFVIGISLLILPSLGYLK